MGLAQSEKRGEGRLTIVSRTRSSRIRSSGDRTESNEEQDRRRRSCSQGSSQPTNVSAEAARVRSPHGGTEARSRKRSGVGNSDDPLAGSALIEERQIAMGKPSTLLALGDVAICLSVTGWRS